MEITLYLAKLLMAWTLSKRLNDVIKALEIDLEPLSKSSESHFNDEGKERTALCEGIFPFLNQHLLKVNRFLPDMHEGFGKAHPGTYPSVGRFVA